MNKNLILIFFILIENFSIAKEYPLDSIKQNWKPYFSIAGLNSWHGKLTPHIWNSPTYGGYNAIPVDEFKTNRKSNVSFLTKPQYSFCGGLQYPIVKNGILGTEVKFSQIVNASDFNKGAFSDQIDPGKGFTLPTNLQDIKINYSYHVISFGLFYQIEQKICKHYTHRMGFKLEYDRLINSVYEIKAIKDKQELFYFNKDLQWYDYYWSLNNFFTYDVKLYHKKRKVIWLNMEYGYIYPYLRRDKYYQNKGETNFHLLSVGLKLEI